jgi:hypothetical protein
MTQLEPVLHDRTTQVVNPVTKSDRFVDFDLVLDRERRCGGRIQDPDLGRENFHLTRRELRVLCVGPPGLDATSHGEHVLGAHLLGTLVRLGCGVGFEDYLRQAGAVTQIDEDDTAMVAPTMNPTTQHDLLSDVLRAESPTVVRAPQVPEDI